MTAIASRTEARCYYYGLPSRPYLVARTDLIPWEMPTGPEAYLMPKEFRMVGHHKIEDIWENDLAPKIHAVLDSSKVDWTSTDLVRIGYVHEAVDSNLIVCIGVEPDTLPFDVGIDVALQCKQVVLDSGIEDVEVEIRESNITSLAGPKLLQPSEMQYSSANEVNPVTPAREPFTFALGIPICSQSTPAVEGTGGFFLDEGGDGKRLFLLTTRHSVLPQAGDSSTENAVFEDVSVPPNQSRHNVSLFGKTSFTHHLDELDYNIKLYFTLDRRDVAAKETEREANKSKFQSLGEAMRAGNWQGLEYLHEDLSTHWAAEDNRVLGRLMYSPRLAVGASPERYTQDIAVIEVDPSKLPTEFNGNIINLNSKYTFSTLIAATRYYSKPAGILYNGHLGLRGIIGVDEMRNPTTHDQTAAPCIFVLKNGRTSGLTFGRANRALSFIHRKSLGVSKEWTILPSDDKKHEPRHFSTKGDSGSVVVDFRGRIGGILHSGCGSEESIDITYVTPISFIMDTIHSYGPLANASPIPGPVDEF
ncbi:hypothetical protein EIP91_008587 [Steccherinum ochraceum]|uniref:Serine protease n=1 Tax=Steccherinum ochraceum TaxID=92696 RepID=A0A4R0R4X5_9APHY|nr:hypothetical protein EIP91_008587 [Steccherinum ochraceum]